jgi:hypothetical protein
VVEHLFRAGFRPVLSYFDTFGNPLFDVGGDFRLPRIAPQFSTLQKAAVTDQRFEGTHPLHLFDKATGEIVSETLLPANTTGVPMTYMANKKQYIVVAVAAAGVPAELIALTLP